MTWGLLRKPQEYLFAGSGENYVLWMHSLGAGSRRGSGYIFCRKNLDSEAGNFFFFFFLELFPAPVLKASSSFPLLEGNPVNLSCETKLLSQSPEVRLYFSFYVGNKTLMNRTTSSEYQILTAKGEDSGSYWCEAITEDGNIIRHSLELKLQVVGEWEWWELTGTRVVATFSLMELRSVPEISWASQKKPMNRPFHSWLKTLLFST